MARSKKENERKANKKCILRKAFKPIAVNVQFYLIFPCSFNKMMQSNILLIPEFDVYLKV